MANSTMTTTSLAMVTPSTVWVKGPLARSSLTTAMAEEGDRAIRMAPASMATASLPSGSISFIKGIYSASRNTAAQPKGQVPATMHSVTHDMLITRFFSSLRYSSLPAAKAIKARENWSIKCSFRTASAEMKSRTKGPARMPVKRKPVIKGRRARVK